MSSLTKKLLSWGRGGEAIAVSATYVIIPQEGEVVNKNGEHVVYKDIVVATACWGTDGSVTWRVLGFHPGPKVYSEDYCARWFSKRTRRL